MFTTLSIIALLVLGQITKKWVIPKFGNFGFHAFLFALAIAINGIHMAMTYYPGFGALVFKAGEFLVSAIGIYEVLFSKLGSNMSPFITNGPDSL